MSSDSAFLAAAVSIGRRLVAEAVFQDGRCSWMGAVADPAQPWRTEYRALEPNLYDGTAGVGLFLAQLASVTGDVAAGRTAVGALRHALWRERALAPTRRDGFHAGSLGIALAAARGAALLNVEELEAGARAVTAPATVSDRCPDVIHGAAGAVIALLALADAFDDPSLRQDAALSGEELIGRATVMREGWSWALPDRPGRRPLCGLSHGAAGIGWALLELYAATGEERFREGAIGAFAYERSWLDKGTGTWPDLRVGGQRRGAARRFASPAAGTWCHGEAGIALTRMRAIEVLGPGHGSHDAEVALDATRRALARALPHEIDDLTLCHGAAGAADVLLCGAVLLGAPSHEAAELGAVALDRYGAGRESWPCGIVGGTAPGLFRGLSGIGWWLLRLHDRTLPSPLTLPIARLTASRAAA
jgi:class II lanthipeptide synthase